VVIRITREQQVDRLRHVWLFSQCSNRELDRLARITKPLSVPEGHVLAREGERGGEFVVIVDGTASVTRAGRSLGQLPAGTFFGEIALLDGGARAATVTAATAMTLLVIDPDDFATLVDGEMPSVARKMLTVVGQRLREADARIARAGTLPFNL
jgi:CRP-like cAMP-binding protein